MALSWTRAFAALALVPLAWTATPAATPQAQPADVGKWSVYGSRFGFSRDDQVPGRGALTVNARAVLGEDWTAGAIMPITDALSHGERFSGVFWARAARPISTTVTIQGEAPDYPIFASTIAELTPQWRQYVVTGIPQRDLAAGSQSLVVRLGKASTDVMLGPMLFQHGTIEEKRIESLFAHLKPAETVQDVRVPSEPGVVLAGRLRLPGRHGKGPFPVVLLLAGSGPSGRGVYPLLEQRLLADGIATFDYDKRGVGESTGTLIDTLEQVEQDATATVAYLRSRPEILTHRIAILGLSQGAIVSPAMGAADPEIAAVVMLAGVVSDRQALVFDQLAHELTAAGIGKEAVVRMVAATRRLLEAKDTNQPAATVAAARQALADVLTATGLTPDDAKAALANLDGPVALSAYRLDLPGTLAKVHAPVLALYAEKDDLVPTRTSLPAAKAALRDNPDATVIEIPDTNHGFQQFQGKSAGKPQWTGAVASAPGVADLICRWLDLRLHTNKRR